MDGKNLKGYRLLLEFYRHHPHHGILGSLAGHIGQGMPVRTYFRRNCDVDDSTSIPAEQRRHCLGELEGADEIHLEGFPHDADFSMKTVHTHIAGNTCVVDQQRQVGVFFLQFLHSFLYAGEICQFDVHPTRHLYIQCLQFTDGFLCPFLIPCADDDLPSAEA